MKRTKEELLSTIKNLAGETPSDEYISLMEDVTDTIEESTEDWKTKYEENDKSWRKKYTERFSEPKEKPDGKPEEKEEPEPPQTFDDLFTTNK